MRPRSSKRSPRAGSRIDFGMKTDNVCGDATVCDRCPRGPLGFTSSASGRSKTSSRAVVQVAGKIPGDLGAYLAELWELAKLYPSGPELFEAVLKVHTQAAGDPALFEDMLAEQADVRENPDFSRKMLQGHLGERRCLGAPRRLVEPVDGA